MQRNNQIYIDIIVISSICTIRDIFFIKSGRSRLQQSCREYVHVRLKLRIVKY